MHALRHQYPLYSRAANADDFYIVNEVDGDFQCHSETSKNCLLIKHSDGWRDDRCERWLRQHGYSTLTHVNRHGLPLPDVRRFSHVVIYGGAPCINDSAYKQLLEPELQLLETALHNDIPCLGICLGAQMIAHVLGADVRPLPCGTTEFGFSLITPTAEGARFMDEPHNMLQWHCEGFELPDSCTLLARGSLFPNQAFQYGDRTFGVQFHPEVTASVLQCWHETHLTGTSANDEVRQQQLHDCDKYAARIDNWCNRFMLNWANA